MKKKKNSIKRREFIKGAAATCALSSVGILPIIRPSKLYAASSRGVYLIVVYLRGGADIGFHLVQPNPNDLNIGSALGSRRPNIIDITPEGQELVGTPYIHANDFPVLQAIHGDGELAIIPRVGMDNFIASHSLAEKAVAYGQANMASSASAGWLNRLGQAHFTKSSDIVDLSGGHPTTTTGGGFNPLTSYRIRQMTNLRTGDYDQILGRESLWRRDAFFLSMLESLQNSNATLDEAQARLAEIGRNIEEVSVADNDIPPNYEQWSTSGNDQAGMLFRDAEMIFRHSEAADTEFDTKVVFGAIEDNGWDSHINQNSFLNGNNDPIDQLNDAINNYRNNTSGPGESIWDNTAILIYTEMGRSNSENGQLGTDHGDANMVLAMGGRVNGGIKGALPTAAQILSKTNTIPRDFSFADVFADIVAGIGYDPGPVWPGFSRRAINLIS